MICGVDAMIAAYKTCGPPKETSTPVAETKKICNRCLAVTYLGYRHNCRSDSYRQKSRNHRSFDSLPYVNNNCQKIHSCIVIFCQGSQKLPARIIRNSFGHDGRSSDDSMKPALKRETDVVSPNWLFSVDDINLCTK